MKKAQISIRRLRNRLCRWQYSYYVQNTSEVSDDEYDSTFCKLRKLEERHLSLDRQSSPTRCVGSYRTNPANATHHKQKMLSLQSINDVRDLRKFDTTIKEQLNLSRSIEYCCELKIDGLSVNLVYENRKLSTASTRGDGRVGEDVTRNVRFIKDIPQRLKDNSRAPSSSIEIRGEVFMTKKNFFKLNEDTDERQGQPFSNPRNAASGSLRRSNSSIVAQRNLSFLCFGHGSIGRCPLPDSHQKRLQCFRKWGIPICNATRRCRGIEQVQRFYERIRKDRFLLDFEIDGIVVKVDAVDRQRMLGTSSRCPRWAVAYKFPPQKKSTKVRRIDFRVGRTGILTPVAKVRPVFFSGTRVDRVNLHSVGQIKKLGLRICDTIEVRRAGDVVPEVTRVVCAKRSSETHRVVYPRRCPACRGRLERERTVLRCPFRWECSAQIARSLQHFVSKKAMNVRGIGNRTILRLIQRKLVRAPGDLFALTVEDCVKLAHVTRKSAVRLVDSVRRSKTTTLSRFLYALGIPGLGESSSTRLFHHGFDVRTLTSSTIDSLNRVPHVGPNLAQNVYDFFHTPRTVEVLRVLLKHLVFRVEE